jgi:hypothetical protein
LGRWELALGIDQQAGGEGRIVVDVGCEGMAGMGVRGSNETGGVMAEMTQLTIGTEASCADGICAELGRVVVDPPLARSPIWRSNRSTGRFVSLDLVDATTGEIRLR